jgi:hypothetical protein
VAEPGSTPAASRRFGRDILVGALIDSACRAAEGDPERSE